jgi:hypothetical protein
MQSHGGAFSEGWNSDIVNPNIRIFLSKLKQEKCPQPFPPAVVALEPPLQKPVSLTTTSAVIRPQEITVPHPEHPRKEAPEEAKSSFAELNRQCDEAEENGPFLGKRERSASHDSFKEDVKPVTEHSRPTRRIVRIFLAALRIFLMRLFPEKFTHHSERNAEGMLNTCPRSKTSYGSHFLDRRTLTLARQGHAGASSDFS